MNLPLINPMKQNDRNRPQQIEQFGLGIQVFKIDPKQDHDPSHKRKAMQHIENPKAPAPLRPLPTVTQNSLKTHKKPLHLPSLSTEKKLSATYTEPRRQTLQKRTPQSTSKASKQPREMRQMREIKEERLKPKPSKVKEQVVVAKQPKEKEVVQLNSIPALNEIVQFQLDLESAEVDNEREIRRLRKEKEGADEDELQRRLNWREVKTGLVETMVQGEDPFFSAQSEWEEWNISDYVQNRCIFPRYDIPLIESP